jgi:hypothetical protein
MNGQHQSSLTCVDPRVPHDWARLLRKLRWIGLEEEARRLEFAVSTLPPEQRHGVFLEVSNTD